MQSRRNFVTGLAGGLAASRVLGANDRIRVGMIGPGIRGIQLLDHLVKQPNVEVVAFADVYTGRLEEARRWCLPPRRTWTIAVCSMTRASTRW